MCAYMCVYTHTMRHKIIYMAQRIIKYICMEPQPSSRKRLSPLKLFEPLPDQLLFPYHLFLLVSSQAGFTGCGGETFLNL